MKVPKGLVRTAELLRATSGPIGARASGQPHALRNVAQNTAWMFGGQGLRAAVQAVYFILIARALGAQSYGTFLGVVALVAIAAPFATVGAGNVLIKNVAASRKSFPLYWGNALIIAAGSSVVLTALVMALGSLLLPSSSMILLFMVALGDLVFGRLTELAGQAYQAVERLDRTAQLLVLASTARLVAAMILSVARPNADATDWAVLYMVASLACAIASLLAIGKEFGGPVISSLAARRQLREGFFFSVSLSAQSIYNDVDKTMLASISTAAATGIYGAAYRVVDLAFMPMRSLLSATYTRFFRQGARGVRGSSELGRRILPIAVGYSLVVGVAVFLTAPAIPRLFGADFRPAVAAARWLSLLPVLKSLHYLAADSLTGAGYQKIRTIVQVAVGAFNILINLWLIPAYSWRGAAWASLASDGILAGCLWGLTVYFERREGQLREPETGADGELIAA